MDTGCIPEQRPRLLTLKKGDERRTLADGQGETLGDIVAKRIRERHEYRVRALVLVGMGAGEGAGCAADRATLHVWITDGYHRPGRPS